MLLIWQTISELFLIREQFSSPDMDYDFALKTILIGDSGAGKSSLMYRFTDDDWNPYYIATIGVDFKVVTLERETKVIKLQVLDTAGQCRFRSIVSSYYRGAHGVIVVFSLDDRASFDNIHDWLKDLHTYGNPDVPCVLVGNKADLPAAKRQVDSAEAAALAKELGMPYVEASARTGDGVRAAFEMVVDAGVKQRAMLAGTVGGRNKPLRLPMAGDAKPKSNSGCPCS